MNALLPHGLWIGAAMGANADSDWYFCGFFERDGQRAVPAHRVAHDAAARESALKFAAITCGQLVHHVAVHAVVRRPRRLRGIEVEPRGDAEVPGLAIAGQLRRAGWCRAPPA